MRCNCSVAVRARRAPDMPSGWPSAMAPPLGSPRIEIVEPSLRVTAGPGGECLVEFDHVQIGQDKTKAGEQFLGRGAGPIPMIRGGTPATQCPDRARGPGVGWPSSDATISAARLVDAEACRGYSAVLARSASNASLSMPVSADSSVDPQRVALRWAISTATISAQAPWPGRGVFSGCGGQTRPDFALIWNYRRHSPPCSAWCRRHIDRAASD